MASGDVLKAALAAMGGVLGELALTVETQRPVKRSIIRKWVNSLRSAADILEKLL